MTLKIIDKHQPFLVLRRSGSFLVAPLHPSLLGHQAVPLCKVLEALALASWVEAGAPQTLWASPGSCLGPPCSRPQLRSPPVVQPTRTRPPAAGFPRERLWPRLEHARPDLHLKTHQSSVQMPTCFKKEHVLFLNVHLRLVATVTAGASWCDPGHHPQLVSTNGDENAPYGDATRVMRVQQTAKGGR